jgi:hypothetical protein
LSIYLKQIEQLIVLQRLDDEILVLENTLTEAPNTVNALENKLETLYKQKNQVEEKVDILEQQKERLNKEIEQDNSKIKKSKNKLMMVENTREYHAMMREMDNLEKTNRMREEEKIALEEELGNQKTSLDFFNEKIQANEEELASKKESMETELEVSKKRLAELNEKRKETTKDIPKPILGRYEFIRSRLNNPVIVPVTSGICSGCNISIPPQSFIELQRGQQILSCPNCQRLIYWEDHFTESNEEGKPLELIQESA